MMNRAPTLSALALAATIAGCGARAELLVSGFAPRPTLVDGGALSDGSTAGADGSAPSDGAVTQPTSPTQQLDMLLVIDNSGSMSEVQSRLMLKFESLLETLRVPRCGSRSNPNAQPRACTGSVDDVPLGQPLRDMHLGVVSTDLGTGGVTVPGCDDSNVGDDGRLNPIRYGSALQSHLPWAPRRPNAQPAPAGFRPAACEPNPEQFPAFVTFCSNTADPSCDRPEPNASTRDPSTFSTWFRCNAGLFINGCGLESPLESAWRALVEHDPRAGSGSPNAGFLRDNALLAIIVITDEEDGSVRQCAHDGGFSMSHGEPCSDATDVYDVSSRAWAHPVNPDLRFYLYTPGDPRDPTWSLDRYADPSGRWSGDFWGLKPGHPERVIFAAVTGVPLQIPAREGRTDYDALLGAPRGGSDDFEARDSSTSVSGTQGSAGPFSMRQANPDPLCSTVVPACRREGSTFDPAQPCNDRQSMAFPSRRIVEVARRFEQSARCAGAPCNNGFVSSICAGNLEPALREIGRKIAARL